MRKDQSKQTAPVLEQTYQFLLWLVPTLEKLPRSQKFLLGDRIQGTALDVLEGLVDATYTQKRQSILKRVNLGLERLRYLMRLSYDLKYIDMKRYEHAVRKLDEIGRQVGGWIKQSRGNQGAVNADSAA